MSYWQRRVTRSVGGVAEEDYVGFDVTAGHEEFLGVGRPAEAVDLFGREMGNLAARFAVEWLQPEVLLIFLAANHVEERMAVGSELVTGGLRIFRRREAHAYGGWLWRRGSRPTYRWESKRGDHHPRRR
jgi:hypothetical protein